MTHNANRPFAELMLEAISGNDNKPDFKFNKMLQQNDSRKETRKAMAGVAFIYDENGDLMGKAELADVSTTGVRVKTSSLNVQAGSNVTIIIVCAGTQFDQAVCRIRWISDIDVRFNCCQMGVEFVTISPVFKDKLFSKTASKRPVRTA